MPFVNAITLAAERLAQRGRACVPMVTRVSFAETNKEEPGWRGIRFCVSGRLYKKEGDHVG